MSDFNPLVSIIIPTYNSETFILEALKSCLKQNHENLELVISDDCSTDETTSLVKGWIGKHEDNFKRVSLTAQKVNLGVRDNTNFLINEAKGAYIRLLEGDDVLVENSVEMQVGYIRNNREAKFLFSDLLIFRENVDDAKMERPAKKTFIEASAKEQYEMLLYGQKANGPSVFFERNMMLQNGGYCGARNCADWTTVIKLTKNGVKLHCLDTPVLYYRRHDSNISTRESDNWKKVSYEMKSLRNNELLKADLAFVHKLYCKQDLLSARKEVNGKLSFKDAVVFFFSRRIYRLIK